MSDSHCMCGQGRGCVWEREKGTGHRQAFVSGTCEGGQEEEESWLWENGRMGLWETPGGLMHMKDLDCTSSPVSQPQTGYHETTRAHYGTAA